MLEHLQLEWIYVVQTLRTPFTDMLFTAMNFFDTDGFYALLIPLIWFGKDWKWGVRFFTLILLSSFCINVAKNIFLEPRPFMIDPKVSIIRVSGWSFPSGGAMSAALLSSLFVYHIRSSLSWILASLFFVLLSFSRVFLGVHYPLDILGGWALGFSLFAFYVTCFPKIETWLGSKPMFLLLLLSCAFPALLWLLCPILTSSLVAMGMFLSVFLCYRVRRLPPASSSGKEFFLRALVSILLSSLLYIGVKKLHATAATFLFCGLFLGVCNSWICYIIHNKLHKSAK